MKPRGMAYTCARSGCRTYTTRTCRGCGYHICGRHLDGHPCDEMKPKRSAEAEQVERGRA